MHFERAFKVIAWVFNLFDRCSCPSINVNSQNTQNHLLSSVDKTHYLRLSERCLMQQQTWCLHILTFLAEPKAISLVMRAHVVGISEVIHVGVKPAVAAGARPAAGYGTAAKQNGGQSFKRDVCNLWLLLPRTTRHPSWQPIDVRKTCSLPRGERLLKLPQQKPSQPPPPASNLHHHPHNRIYQRKNLSMRARGKISVTENGKGLGVGLSKWTVPREERFF